jgi:hypothetical protein
MRNVLLFIVGLVFTLTAYSQSVNSPTASAYPQSTANQLISGFSVSGFNSSSTLLVTIGLVNPPSGTTLRLGTTSGIVASTGYNLTNNFTRISFTGTQANINTVLAALRLNTGSIPGNVYIAVTATVNPTGFFYLPSNGHFYRPISSGATYTNARAAALNTTFKGQQGYLVTITSADEDAFIFNNVPQSQIWFALTDEAVEGQWRIDAGPEAGTLIKTSNGQFAGNIAGKYNNWAPGEPNNSGNEDYAVTKWNGSQWNDLPNNFSCPYVIEYGTWTDPADQTFTDFFTGFVTHQIACSPATSPASPTGVNGSRTNAGTVTLSATAQSGAVVDWYANPTGGNVLSGGLGTSTFTTPSITTTTTYYAQARNSTTGCVSSTRTAVTATVNYPTPFSYSGNVYNVNGLGVPGIQVKVLYKTKAASTYATLSTVTTNVNGSFNISTQLDISAYDFQIVIENLNPANPDSNDALAFNQKVLGQNFNSIDYYRMNTNSNNNLSISDVYLVYRKINGGNWPAGVPSYRLFTQAEWSVIGQSTANLLAAYPGVQTVTLTNPTVGGSSNFYLIKTGHQD